MVTELFLVSLPSPPTSPLFPYFLCSRQPVEAVGRQHGVWLLREFYLSTITTVFAHQGYAINSQMACHRGGGGFGKLTNQTISLNKQRQTLFPLQLLSDNSRSYATSL